ncbi:hypothetical protein TRVA0_001S04126 [Trichomonascus vanleenenianus]|uniref:uncharacterized protein n=1 Tax=Trichomonascus vanleenenianus TaxID=2268995 RepID=UPI003ECA6300
MGAKQFTVFVSPARTKENKENIPPPNSPIVLRSVNNKKRTPLRNLEVKKPKDELAFIYLDSQLVEPRSRAPARRMPTFPTTNSTTNRRMVMMR